MNRFAHFHNDDDWRMSEIPPWFDAFWDYPRNPTYAWFEAMVRNNRLPRLSIFAGPPGSGKTASAYLLACSASCPKFDPTTHRPCGACDVCMNVRLGKDSFQRGALLEIDGAFRGTGRAIEQVYEAQTHTLA